MAFNIYKGIALAHPPLVAIREFDEIFLTGEIKKPKNWKKSENTKTRQNKKKKKKQEKKLSPWGSTFCERTTLVGVFLLQATMPQLTSVSDVSDDRNAAGRLARDLFTKKSLDAHLDGASWGYGKPEFWKR